MILAGGKIAPLSIKSIPRENVIYTFIIKSETFSQI